MYIYWDLVGMSRYFQHTLFKWILSSILTRKKTPLVKLQDLLFYGIYGGKEMFEF